MPGRIIEVTRVGSEESANELLAEGWELYAVVAKSPQEKVPGVHWIFARRDQS